MDANEVKEKLLQNAYAVVSHLLPAGSQKGNEWWCGGAGGSSGLGSGQGDTLKIVIEGHKAGIWMDYSTEDKGNNLLELWRYCKGCEFVDAFHEARDWLGYKPESQAIRKPVSKKKKQYAVPDASSCQTIFQGSPVEVYLVNERKIHPQTIISFQIMQGQRGDDIVFPYVGLDGKYEMLKHLALERDGDKKRVWASKDSKKSLFGKHLIGKDDRYLIITEGEIDAMTYWQLGYRACSVPFGAKWETRDGRDPNDEWIENDWEFLERFEAIYLSFDMDEQGKKAAASIVSRIGHDRCFLIELPAKDANELLMKGNQDAIHTGIQNAKAILPEQLKNAIEYRDSLVSRFLDKSETATGISLPFTIPHGKQFRIRFHELTIFTGFSGSGKTMLLNFIIVWLKSIGRASCVASLEVRPDETLKYMTNQITGLGDDYIDNREILDKAINWLAEGIWFYEHVGQSNIDKILEVFEYAFRRFKVQYFIIDSMMKCGIKEDDYNGQKEAIDKITSFCDKYEVHVFLVAHSRKMGDEATSRTSKFDVKGSGSITDQAHNIITIWRNKKKEKLIDDLLKRGNSAEAEKIDRIEFDTMMQWHKQRNGTGDEPTIHLFFDKQSRQFHDHRREPIQYVSPVDESNEPF